MDQLSASDGSAGRRKSSTASAAEVPAAAAAAASTNVRAGLANLNEQLCAAMIGVVLSPEKRNRVGEKIWDAAFEDLLKVDKR